MSAPVLVTDVAQSQCHACGAYTLTVNLPELRERRCWPCLEEYGEGPQVPVYDPDDPESDPAYWRHWDSEIDRRLGK